MLCAVPALRALRIAFRHAHITLVGLPWAEQFFHRFRHYLDDFLAFPGHPALPEQPGAEQHLVTAFYDTVRACQFDLVLQMHGSGQVSNAVARDFGAVQTAGFIPPAVLQSPLRSPSPLYLAYPETDPEPLRLLKLAAH